MSSMSRITLLRVLCAIALAARACDAFCERGQFHCQRWCPIAKEQRMYLECCDFVEKFGDCPSSDEQHYDHDLVLESLHCCSDSDCPEGLKCCREANYPVNLCKPVMSHCPSAPAVFPEMEEASGSGDFSGWHDDNEDDSGGYSGDSDDVISGSGFDYVDTLAIANEINKEEAELKEEGDFTFDNY